MADFKQALPFTLAQEGGYANDPDDSGGETWRGISRRNWEQWDGWPIIDNAKAMMNDSNRDHIFKMLAASEELQDRVERFYRAEFWPDTYDQIVSQEVATKLFDWGVNMGTHESVKCLQRAISCCNPGPFDVDGAFGVRTLGLANSIKPEDLLPQFIAAAKAHYRGIVEEHPKDVKFLKGWLARADKLPAHSAETEQPATS